MAFCFGLLHGFGFAGALTQIGIPPGDVPLALFAFNVGVEVGQLAFIAATLLVVELARRIGASTGTATRARMAAFAAFASAAILTAGLAACASQETEPATPAVEVPANDNLNAVLWTQRSVEFKGNAETAFALARIRLDQALRDRGWTAAPPTASAASCSGSSCRR